MNELVNEENFLEECLTIFEAIYYLKGSFGVLDYYAITDINFKELFQKYCELSKKHPQYRVPCSALGIVREYLNNNLFNYLSDNVEERLLKRRTKIKDIEFDEMLVKRVKYELGKRGYQNYTFTLERLDLSYGLLYEAIARVIQNDGNFHCLNKEVVLTEIKSKVQEKKDENMKKNIKMIFN